MGSGLLTPSYGITAGLTEFGRSPDALTSGQEVDRHDQQTAQVKKATSESVDAVTAEQEDGWTLLDFFIQPANASRRNLSRHFRSLEQQQPGFLVRGKQLEHDIRQLNPNARFASLEPSGAPRYTARYVRALEMEYAREVTNAANRAQAEAWRMERDRVRHGTSQNNWTFAQANELLRTGKVEGYVAHHTFSVARYPHLAGRPEFIRFMTPEEHFRAHGNNWSNPTHGP